MTDFNYTDEMYNEDRKLATWFFNKKYKWLLASVEDDILSMCVAKLWKERPLYNKELCAYSTWAGILIRTVVGHYISHHNGRNGEIICMS